MDYMEWFHIFYVVAPPTWTTWNVLARSEHSSSLPSPAPLGRTLTLAPSGFLVPKKPSVLIIMPRKSTSSYRKLLIARVANRGVIMAFKCVACQKANSDCVRSKESSSCLACLRRTRPCKMEPFSDSEFAKVDKERARLETEMESLELAEEAILQKRRRIRKLQRYLASKEAEMIRRGLDNVEELEKMEAQEEAEKTATTALDPSSSFDQSFLESLTPSFLDGFVLPGKTVEGAPGSS